MECKVYRTTTLTASLLLFPRLKRKRRDLRGASFLSALGEKQPALPDSTLKRIHNKQLSTWDKSRIPCSSKVNILQTLIFTLSQLFFIQLSVTTYCKCNVCVAVCELWTWKIIGGKRKCVPVYGMSVAKSSALPPHRGSWLPSRPPSWWQDILRRVQHPRSTVS